MPLHLVAQAALQSEPLSANAFCGTASGASSASAIARHTNSLELSEYTRSMSYSSRWGLWNTPTLFDGNAYRLLRRRVDPSGQAEQDHSRAFAVGPQERFAIEDARRCGQTHLYRNLERLARRER